MFKRFFVVLLFIFCSSENLCAQSIKDIFMSGLQALEDGHYDQAIERFETTIKMKPDLAPAYNFLGVAYKAKGKDAFEVISYFERAIELDPKYALAYDNLGKSYYGLGNYDKALKYCLKAESFDESLMTTQLSLGWIYLLGQSEPKSAIRHFKRVIEKNRTPYACLGLGIAYFQDHQNALVLEMITYLRKLGEEKYASHLENMLKQGRYLSPTINGISLQMPQSQKGILVDDKSNTLGAPQDARQQAIEDIKNMPVYLKGRLDEDSTQEPSSLQNTYSGADRIKALQQNSRPQNLPGY
jgi:tetratricopeptide (TPR) repeat protein